MGGHAVEVPRAEGDVLSLARRGHVADLVGSQPDLRQRIGKHGAVGRRVQHIGAAILLAQADIGRAYVEQEDILAFDRVC